jgi:hypothetical protein
MSQRIDVTDVFAQSICTSAALDERASRRAESRALGAEDYRGA